MTAGMKLCGEVPWHSRPVSDSEDEIGAWYALLRARGVGMLVARTDEEHDLLLHIGRVFSGEASAPAPTKPLSELVPMTESEQVAVRSVMREHMKPLREAYLRGMAIAHDEEQKGVLEDLRSSIGPPRDG